MGFRDRKNQAGTDTATVERVRAMMRRHLAEGGQDAAVRVAYVLDLLNPRGMWSHDPESPVRVRDVPLPGERDSLTGARWPGPPGSKPPE